MSSVRVAVVGGGIGGLTAALALRSVGADADVYEQAPALGEVGAGVALAPAGLRILERLGVADAVTRSAVPISRVDLRRSDGTSMAPPGAAPSTAGQAMGRGVYRPDLVGALAGALPDGVLHTGHPRLNGERMNSPDYRPGANRSQMADYDVEAEAEAARASGN